MKKIYKRVAFFLTMLLLVGQIFLNVSYAQSSLEEQQQQILEQIEKNKEQQNQLENEKKDAQEVVDGLQNEANQLKGTYSSLNQQLQQVNGEISQTHEDISNATSDIAQLEKDLKKAQENRDAQYEGMKKRIQYMYENGTDSVLVSILTSGSVAEFIKRAEYASMIAEYDRQMVQAYEKLEDTITAKSTELTQKQEQLSAYQKTLADKQEQLGELVDNAGDAYASKQGEVSAAQMTAEEFDAKIAQFRAQEQAYEQQYAANQAALAQQIAQESGDIEEDTSGALTGYTEADLKLMAAIIQAEAGGESYEGQLAVGTVIMNRVMSSKFPNTNTIAEVVYAPGQFQPVRDGHLALILERGPNESCTNAARQVLGGYRSGDWLFFMTQKWADYYGITGYTMIGNHAFFCKWGAN